MPIAARRPRPCSESPVSIAMAQALSLSTNRMRGLSLSARDAAIAGSPAVHRENTSVWPVHARLRASLPVCARRRAHRKLLLPKAPLPAIGPSPEPLLAQGLGQSAEGRAPWPLDIASAMDLEVLHPGDERSASSPHSSVPSRSVPGARGWSCRSYRPHVSMSAGRSPRRCGRMPTREPSPIATLIEIRRLEPGAHGHA